MTIPFAKRARACARERMGMEKKKRTKERFSQPVMPSVARYRTDQLYQRLRLYANGRRLISIMSINLLFFCLQRWPTSPVPTSTRKHDASRILTRRRGREDGRFSIHATPTRYRGVISRSGVKFNWCSRECKFSPINST